jgi:hypothetical protein
MKASDLFEILKTNFLITKPDQESLKRYEGIKREFIEMEILEHNFFSQVRNSVYEEEEITFELMVFNNEFVHDIGISNHRADIITLPTQKITRVCLTCIKANEIGLTINAFGYEGSTPDLYYKTSIDKFTELSLVRTNLLGLIK